MTGERAHTVANVVLASVAVAAAYVVITTPSLRRLAKAGLRLWLASVPAYLATEVRRAWMESAPAA
jgi:hypothetical protein